MGVVASEYPTFKATQVYKRLKSFEFSGSYTTVANYTQRYRKKRIEVYHELIFLPGGGGADRLDDPHMTPFWSCLWLCIYPRLFKVSLYKILS
jgi:hypothetical protein